MCPYLISTCIVFVLLEETQQEHGIRTDDYLRYRQYCTRKLERLRAKFNLHHSSKTKTTFLIPLNRRIENAEYFCYSNASAFL